ncbi:putative Short chain type dehydrogenase [Seiridium cardinale]|uniref:Short chain type dehydrogenase n=1 Tax=Seiridium cardinale TaxID=138064 RepID=A0ABR2XG94_9PEZI
MPSTSPVVLILGAGPNIGQAVARTFASKGYKVAIAARSLNEADSTDKQLNITSDFANSDDVISTFERVQKVFGIPSVVVYNVSASTLTPPQDPFALPLAALNRDVAINVTSAFVAAQQAASGFAQLPASASRTFIYTGNILNTAILPAFIDQGIGKSAGAHMIWAASAAYQDRGFKFYYGDERKADGSAKYRVDGAAHADIYWKLAEEKKQGPWLQTFVKGMGYKNFEGQ